MPKYRRALGRQTLIGVLQRVYDEAPPRELAIAKLARFALEFDEYWVLVKRIAEAPREDIIRFTRELRRWGLPELGELAVRVRVRFEALEAFEALIEDPDTLELSGVHRLLERNAWLFGEEYESFISNKTLRTVIEKTAGTVYGGTNWRKRPDLLLIGQPKRRLLVELKRPEHQITWRDIAQAEEYRDTLRAHLPEGILEVLVIGGTIEPTLHWGDHHHLRATTFHEIADTARTRLQWLVGLPDPDVESPFRHSA